MGVRPCEETAETTVAHVRACLRAGRQKEANSSEFNTSTRTHHSTTTMAVVQPAHFGLMNGPALVNDKLHR